MNLNQLVKLITKLEGKSKKSLTTLLARVFPHNTATLSDMRAFDTWAKKFDEQTRNNPVVKLAKEMVERVESIKGENQ